MRGASIWGQIVASLDPMASMYSKERMRDAEHALKERLSSFLCESAVQSHLGPKAARTALNGIRSQRLLADHVRALEGVCKVLLGESAVIQKASGRWQLTA